MVRAKGVDGDQDDGAGRGIRAGDEAESEDREEEQRAHEPIVEGARGRGKIGRRGLSRTSGFGSARTRPPEHPLPGETPLANPLRSPP